MSQFLESFEVSDLALGKPPLHCLPTNATVADAIAMLRDLGLTETSVWDAPLSNCLGVVSNLHLLCFLAAAADLDSALSSPIAPLVHTTVIPRLHLHQRLSKALELVIQGAQFLIVPLPESMMKSSRPSSPWPRKDLCWISQEAVMRFLMSCIAAFCPLPLFTIDELGIIDRNFDSVDRDSPAIDAVDKIHRASRTMSAVAIVVADQTLPPSSPSPSPSAAANKLRLVGDISSSTLRSYDDNLAAVAAALATLTAGDFLSYIRGSNKRSSRLLGKLIESRLAQKKAAAETAPPADEEHAPAPAPPPPLPLPALPAEPEESSDSEHDSSFGSNSFSSSSGGLSSSFQSSGIRGCLTCRPWSSLAAVMAQALSHQCSYVWVTDSDSENTVVGIVTYVDMIRVLVKKLNRVGRLGSSQKLFSSTPKLVTRPDQLLCPPSI